MNKIDNVGNWGNIISKNEDIQLRKTEVEDLEFVIESERDYENAKFVGQWTKEEHLCSLDNEDILHLIIEKTDTKKAIGYVIIAGIQNPNNSIEFRRFVVCEKGNGFGRKTLELIKELSFTKLNAHRLWLDVRVKNIRAQRVYKSEGFSEEGILRECVFHHNEYESLIIMSILKSEYKK